MIGRQKIKFLAGALVVLVSSRVVADSGRQLPIEAYQRAEAVRLKNIAAVPLNLGVVPIWLPAGDGFWFREQTLAGWRYVAVDPGHSDRHEAFNHGKLATAIAKISGTSVDADHLPLTELTLLDEHGRHIRFSVDKTSFSCEVASSVCSATDVAAKDAFIVEAPNHAIAAFARNDNIWVRDLKTGGERQLTSDGEAHFAYGKWPDSGLLTVLQASSGKKLPPFGFEWSPDSRRLVVTRVDERALPEYYFLQSVPYDGSRRPKLISIRTTLSGESIKAAAEMSIIDVASGVGHKLATGAEGLSLPYWWSTDNERFLAIQSGDYSRKTTLFSVNAASGALREVLSEESRTFLQVSPLEYDEPAVRYLPLTEEVVWFSQRDGWNHLYLVDGHTGRIKAKLGEGNWSVQNIIRLDERKRVIYFSAAGREPNQDPYFRHLYSVRLDGRGLTLLTPEAADHVFTPVTNPAIGTELEALGFHSATPQPFSPSGRYFIDTWSTVSAAPVSVVRTADGHTVMRLVKADVSGLLKTGWSTPEAFQAKAADAKTELYGVLIKPARFDAARRYPVIDYIYNGPQVVTTPHDFAGGLNDWVTSRAQCLAQLGFVVMVMDGRGTPMRSKAFQDYMYNNMQEFALEDHVAVLKELAFRLPYMDIGRLGVIGHSFGGYAAMKAILGYPDFYKAAVASAGPYDMYGLYALDAFFDPPIFSKDTTPPAAVRLPINWGRVDLTEQAGQLKGKLMLAYGDLDENSYPAVTARMVNALVKANKEFELVYLPNRSHAYVDEPYFTRRTWDFFVRSLLDEEPPKDYAFANSK